VQGSWRPDREDRLQVQEVPGVLCLVMDPGPCWAGPKDQESR